MVRESVSLDPGGQLQDVVWEMRREGRGVRHGNLLSRHCEMLQVVITKKRPSLNDASSVIGAVLGMYNDSRERGMVDEESKLSIPFCGSVDGVQRVCCPILGNLPAVQSLKTSRLDDVD